VTTGVIDEDAAHHLRRDAEEMRSILPVALVLVDEPDEDLVNQGRRLKGVIGPLLPKLPRRDLSELRVDEREQLIERSLVAATPISEKCRDIARRSHPDAGILPPSFVPLTHSSLPLRDLL
jgi:hypothetical protein